MSDRVSGKRILITGGFGFIGSHLLARLNLDSSSHITVIDDLRSAPLPLDQVLKRLCHPRSVEHHVMSISAYFSSWNGQAFDEIYHLASPVGPAGILGRAGQIAREVIEDTSLIADVCLESRSRLVYMSSSEVYQGGCNGLCSEEMPRMVTAHATVRGEYSAAKIAAELMVENQSRVKGLDVRVVRPFNVAGPGQSGRGGFVLPRFVAQALAQRPLTLFGDGTQIRCFTHVREIVEGLIMTMKDDASGEVYNLGRASNRISIHGLADLVQQLTGAAVELAFVEPKQIFGELYEEASDKFPDTGKAARQLGWQPQFDCRRIVDDTVSFMRGLPEEARSQLGGI